MSIASEGVIDSKEIPCLIFSGSSRGSPTSVSAASITAGFLICLASNSFPAGSIPFSIPSKVKLTRALIFLCSSGAAANETANIRAKETTAVTNHIGKYFFTILKIADKEITKESFSASSFVNVILR